MKQSVQNHPTTMRYDPTIHEYRVTCSCGFTAQIFERTEAEQVMNHHALHAGRVNNE